MTTSSVITLFSVPQTPSINYADTTPGRFDDILEKLETAIATVTAAGWVTAKDALEAFLDDRVTNDYVLVRELAMALDAMISLKAAPHDEQLSIANAALDLATNDTVPDIEDWDARERQCRATASIMFAIIPEADRLHPVWQLAFGTPSSH